MMTNRGRSELVRHRVYIAPSGRKVRFLGMHSVKKSDREGTFDAHFEYVPEEIWGAAQVMREQLVMSAANVRLMRPEWS